MRNIIRYILLCTFVLMQPVFALAPSSQVKDLVPVKTVPVSAPVEPKESLTEAERIVKFGESGNPYRALGVAEEIKGKNREERERIVKKAYRQLALAYHPDKCALANATAIFQSLQRAYDRISSDNYEDYKEVKSVKVTLFRKPKAPYQDFNDIWKESIDKTQDHFNKNNYGNISYDENKNFTFRAANVNQAIIFQAFLNRYNNTTVNGSLFGIVMREPNSLLVKFSLYDFDLHFPLFDERLRFILEQMAELSSQLKNSFADELNQICTKLNWKEIVRCSWADTSGDAWPIDLSLEEVDANHFKVTYKPLSENFSNLAFLLKSKEDNPQELNMITGPFSVEIDYELVIDQNGSYLVNGIDMRDQVLRWRGKQQPLPLAFKEYRANLQALNAIKKYLPKQSQSYLLVRDRDARLFLVIDDPNLSDQLGLVLKDGASVGGLFSLASDLEKALQVKNGKDIVDALLAKQWIRWDENSGEFIFNVAKKDETDLGVEGVDGVAVRKYFNSKAPMFRETEEKILTRFAADDPSVIVPQGSKIFQINVDDMPGAAEAIKDYVGMQVKTIKLAFGNMSATLSADLMFFTMLQREATGTIFIDGTRLTSDNVADIFAACQNGAEIKITATSKEDAVIKYA